MTVNKPNEVDDPIIRDGGLHLISREIEYLLDSTNMPRSIELAFRKELGSINPLVCLMDIAMSSFALNLESSKNKLRFLRKEAAKHGHSGLYTDHLNFHDSHHVSYNAMFALIQSKSDSFCRRIQNHPCLNQDYKSEAKGDFLRRTIFVIIKSSYPDISPSNPVDQNDFDFFIDINDMFLIDYYRTIRNEEFHNSGHNKKNDHLINLYEKINIYETNEKFDIMPKKPEAIDIKDVILFSKVWQKIARDIAKWFINFDNYVVEYLRKRFGRLKHSRRDNAVRKFLSHEFLFDESEIVGLARDLWAG